MKVRVILAVILVFVVGSLYFAQRTVRHGSTLAETAAKKSTPYLDISDEGSSVWRNFRSGVGYFQIEFPAYPQHTKEKLPIPNTDLYLRYDIYVAEPDETSSFMVSLINYPEEITVKSPEDVLQTVMNEMLLANPANKLQNVQERNEEHPTLEFEIQNPEIRMRNRALMVGHTLYLITVTQNVGSDLEGDFTRFMSSFELLTDLRSPSNKE